MMRIGGLRREDQPFWSNAALFSELAKAIFRAFVTRQQPQHTGRSCRQDCHPSGETRSGNLLHAVKACIYEPVFWQAGSGARGARGNFALAIYWLVAGN